MTGVEMRFYLIVEQMLLSTSILLYSDASSVMAFADVPVEILHGSYAAADLHIDMTDILPYKVWIVWHH